MTGILLFGASAHAWASLEWKTTQIEVDAGVEDQSAKAVYEFKNTGTAPVSIKSIQTSCGCTNASDARGIYQPGQSGKIEVEFKFQGRKGLQQKTIIVEMPDQEPGMQVLTFRVQIPNDIALSKEALVWEKGVAPEAQSISVTLLNPRSKLTAVSSTNANFEAKFEELEPGKIFRVNVKPVATDQPGSAVIRLEFSEPAGRSMFLPVRIKN